MTASERYELDAYPWACPTQESLLEAIEERIAKWIADGREHAGIYALSGIGQFGLVEKPLARQLEIAKGFWSSYIGNCCCCGISVHSPEEQPECGHLYCDICLGRGHEEDCLQGQCEGLS